MKNRAFIPFIWLGLFILIVGLACGASSGEPTPVPPTAVPPTAVVPTEVPPTDVPTQVPTEVPPTEAPLPSPTPLPPPTDEPPPTDVPAVATPPDFYTEEFDGSSSSYYPDEYLYFVQSGPDNVAEAVQLNDGYLTFNIDTESTYIYLYYQYWLYTDVRVQMQANNIGKNSQYVSLVCRYDPDLGWIEFNVAGDGTYSILAYSVLDNEYKPIYNGGSTAIKIGPQTNDYIAECIGNEIALFVNGVEVRTMAIPNALQFLDEGYVGFSVGSENSTPIIVDINWFAIESP